MRLKLDRDVVFLDLEATGVDAARDRIVQIAMVRLAPDGGRTAFESLVDPELPIPPEAAAIHGITDEMVRSAPRFRDAAPRIREFLGGADVGGFNVARYDVPMLCAEFRRCGAPLDMAGRRVVDALTIFHRFEPRNLAAACAFYCGRALKDAHTAMADAEASLDVFLAQVERYRGDGGGPALPADIQGLHDFCAAGDPKNVDSRGKFVWRHGGAAFNFGRYQTRPLEEVVRTDPSYVQWLAGGSNEEVARICRRALEGEFPRKER